MINISCNLLLRLLYSGHVNTSNKVIHRATSTVISDSQLEFNCVCISHDDNGTFYVHTPTVKKKTYKQYSMTALCFMQLSKLAARADVLPCD